MLRVLFVCIHNSARSQMAEAFFNLYATRTEDTAQSAGITPGKLNPYVVRAMAEKEVDISHNPTKAVFDLYKEGKKFSHVIAVCDESSEHCPIFPGVHKVITWSFQDPSKFTGSDEEIMQKVRIVRDEIEARVKNFLQSF